MIQKPDTMARLAAERAALNAAQRALNERLKVVSGGRSHNQGCSLGGLATGMGANVSGDICWCGYSTLPAEPLLTVTVKVRSKRREPHPVRPVQPRQSPTPCDPTCVGWAVFGHGTGEDLEIQQCDECWHGVADAPGDEYYQAHPTCQLALEAARANDEPCDVQDRLPLDE